MKALRTVTWNCNENKYLLVEGESLLIDDEDVVQAKASGLFEEVEEVKLTKKDLLIEEANALEIDTTNMTIAQLEEAITEAITEAKA